jgi:hypothetical protein
MAVHAVLAMLLALSLASDAAAAAAAAAEPQSTLQYAADYSVLGPCSIAEQPLEPLVLPQESGCGNYCRLSPYIHLPVPPNSSTSTTGPAGPAVNSSSTRCSAAPAPTVIFFSGFQLRSAYYTPYARWLASWGYACVQYDLALLHIVPDEVEVRALCRQHSCTRIEKTL